MTMENTIKKDNTELVFEARIRTNDVDLILQLLEMGILNVIGVNKDIDNLTEVDSEALSKILKRGANIYTYYEDCDCIIDNDEEDLI